MAKNTGTKTPVRRNRAAADGSNVDTTKVDTPAPTVHTFESRNGMTFTYEETDAPALTRMRQKAVNPHDQGIKLAAEKVGTGRAFRVGPFTPDEVAKHERWLRTGGNNYGVTIRVQSDPVGDGTNNVTLRFWAVPKIVKRKRAKDAEALVNAGDGSEATAEVAGY